MQKRILIPGLILTAALLMAAGRMQEEHLLRFELNPNSVDKYKVQMSMNMTLDAPGAPPNLAVNSSMDFELKTGAIDEKGLADVEMKTTNMVVETSDVPAGTPPPDLPKEMIVTGKIDNRYRLTEAKQKGLTGEAALMMNMSNANQTSMFIELPEKPVKVGDSWKFSMAKNPMLGEKDHQLTATLKGLAIHEGIPAFEIEISGKIELDVNMAEAMKKAAETSGGAGGAEALLGGMDIVVKGSIGVGGKVFLAQKGGRLLYSETAMDSKQSMEMMGMTMNIDGKTNMKMSLAK